MRTEQRTIVPFKGASAAEALLDSITFDMSIDGSAPTPAEEVERIHPAHLPSLSLAARFAFSESDLDHLAEETGIARSNMLLVLVATGNVARRSGILAKWELDKDLSEPINHVIKPSSSGMAAIGDASGFAVTALIRLRSGLERVPLRANVAGTVLARRSVSFRLPQDNPGLSPIPLTVERRAELGLPEHCMTFVQCDSLLEADDLTSRVSVYVDEAILSELTVETPITRQIQAGLSIDVVIAMASQIHRELEESGATRGSFAETAAKSYTACGTFLARTCKAMGVDDDFSHKEEILDWARNNPALLRANLEHGWGIRDLTKRMMREGVAS